MNRFEDDRGVIEDVLGRVDAVTRITTVAGAVRGNHYHERTTQWTLVVKGRLLVASDAITSEVGPGAFVKHEPFHAHAWRALSDAECFVFTRGPRSGQGYESDVVRLKEPLL